VLHFGHDPALFGEGRRLDQVHGVTWDDRYQLSR
jgi:hypothetical protein